MEEDIDDILQLGEEAHLLLEIIDFKNPDLSFIESDFLKERIQTFLKQPLLNKITDGIIYKEYPFVIEDGKTSAHGIIDLFIVYNDHIDVIDYKLNFL